MKCKQLPPGFELWLSRPFSTTVNIPSQALPVIPITDVTFSMRNARRNGLPIMGHE